MALDRALGEQQPFGDLAVGQAGGDERQDLALAVREGRPFDARPQLARHHRLAAGDREDGNGQRGLDLGLEDDGVGAGIECATDARAGSRGGDDDYRSLGKLAAQAAQSGHLAG